MKIIAKNKKAFFDYNILETVEAGIVLTGDEVKSLRAGRCSLVGAYAVAKGGELFMINCHIPVYDHAYDKNDDTPKRSRKLLLHKRELNKLIGDISKKGITLVPLKLYLNKRGLVKVQLGVCKHKKAPDKKKALKERDIRRETARELKDKFRY